MLGRVIRRSFNFFRPIGVHSLQSFIGFLKDLGCTSVTGEISVTTGSRNQKGVDIYLSSRTPNGRYVIWKREGTKWPAENVENICARSMSVLQGNMEIIQKEVPGIATVIVDWEGTKQQAV